MSRQRADVKIRWKSVFEKLRRPAVQSDLPPKHAAVCPSGSPYSTVDRR